MSSQILNHVLRRLSALEHRVRTLMRTGKVAEVRADPYRVRVEVARDDDDAPVLTDWLPVCVPRAGDTRTWSPLTVGERCLVWCPGGDEFAGVVGMSLFSDQFPAPSADLDLHLVDSDDVITVQAGAAQQIDLVVGTRVFRVRQ